MPLRIFSVFCTSVLLVVSGFAQQVLPPTPYGGNAALRLLLENELVYPRKALREGTEGMVNLFFIVEKDGSIRNLSVWQSLSPETDNEAIRVLRKVLWHPARMGNMTMASEHYLRVEFKVRKYKKIVKRRGYDTLPAVVVPMDTSEFIWKNEDLDTIATSIVPAEFPDLAAYLSSLITYPVYAFQLSIEGNIELEFVVEQHGGISNVRAINWVGGGCYEEAVRLYRATRWMPAIKNGKAVRSFARITIEFELPEKPVLDY